VLTGLSTKGLATISTKFRRQKIPRKVNGSSNSDAAWRFSKQGLLKGAVTRRKLNKEYFT